MRVWGYAIAVLAVVAFIYGVFHFGRSYEGTLRDKRAAEAAIEAAKRQTEALDEYRKTVNVQLQRFQNEKAALEGRLASYEEYVEGIGEDGVSCLSADDVGQLQRLNGQ